MKKTFLFFFMALMMSWNGLKAQADYIIMLDNGSSVTNAEYANMKRGAIKLMEQLLACNTRNRVAVVQYGTGKYGDTNGTGEPLIYIESDFTNDHFTAQNFERRLDFGDLFNESLALIADAFNGAGSAGIISPQTALNNVQPLKFVVFTDAERNSGGPDGSYLVNYNNTTYSDPAAFEMAVKFKTIGAQFTMIHANTNSSAAGAAASIASAGGLYTGGLEPNVSDPDYGVLPRLYYSRPNGFSVGQPEMDYWSDLASNICNTNGMGTVNFRYEPGECIQQPSGIGGYYNLPPGATLVNFKLELIGLQNGTVFPVPFNPTLGVGAPNFYNYYLQPSDFAAALSGGAIGEQKFRVSMIYLYNGNYEIAYAWNNYPFFDYDITMKCPHLRAVKLQTEEKIFKLTPNPTNGLFKVILNKEIKSGTLEIRDLTGYVVYNKILRDEKEIEVDLSSRKEGIYIVNVTTDKNEVYSEKIIKK
ncbi:Por secretion system C-terminal sorting domain-containing protein [Chryseobacterium ureilyticum]|uniref:Por secretion system C-terminal sorting domain-containing protein n=1 Tax=Chryseobacterium ureilyticum TaxID=373668 RepID=A0A1N7PK34_9FLAO|nr:T9SS type A sorting domain-containing protein [Chryseobacterium ureilyticum]SIT10951.1 Por secretion system C-terminal sorting domain-containing protein [Chryseobacterium ureilyticum]